MYNETRGLVNTTVSSKKMGLFTKIKQWWVSQQGISLPDSLTVDFDEKEIRVCVLRELEPEWNQTFLWSDIVRVCFEDGGLLSSDMVYITLRNKEEVAQVPTEARNGSKFFGELCDRGFMPEKVWRKAMGDTSGGMHCWPPFDK